MLKRLKIALLLPITLCLFSCGSPEAKTEVVKPRVFPEYAPELDEIIRTPEGVIRGVDLNVRSEAVSKAEKNSPSESDSTYVYYEYTIDTETDYSVAYTFVDDSLEEIEIQVNCKDVDQSTKIFNDLKNYYERKLPNPMEDKGYVVYNCFTGERRPFVVSLTDNSTTAQGIINLVIYKDK